MNLLRISRRMVPAIVLFLTMLAPPAFSQIDTTHRDDTLFPSDTSMTVDTTGTFSADSSFLSGISTDTVEFFAREPDPFIKGRSGLIYLTGLVAGSSLNLEALDPRLKGGSLVFYGFEGFTLLNGLLIGGGWSGAHLYGAPAEYDQFSFDYGGILLGYDARLRPLRLSVRGAVMIASGGLEMIRKDSVLTLSTGREILERVRHEGFYALRPGISIGISPIQYFDLRLGVDYLLPLGGSSLADLRNLTYGIRVAFGIGE
ncbi:MAG: hypothetical protein ABI876_05495 [Bacteroidota bacterium]